MAVLVLKMHVIMYKICDLLHPGVPLLARIPRSRPQRRHDTDYIQPSRLFESFASRRTPICKPLSGIVNSAEVPPAGYLAIVELIAEASPWWSWPLSRFLFISYFEGGPLASICLFSSPILLKSHKHNLRWDRPRRLPWAASPFVAAKMRRLSTLCLLTTITSLVSTSAPYPVA